MTYSCPVCNSMAVEQAGATDTYQSLICRDCHSWSTVPVVRERPSAPAVPRRPRQS